LRRAFFAAFGDAALWQTVQQIYCKDVRVPHVSPAKTRDNHLHIGILVSWIMFQKLMSMSCFILFSSCCSAEDFALNYKPAPSRYMVYSGALDDPEKPIAKDSKISFFGTGQAAKEMFNAMPPDIKDNCVSDSGSRYRAKDNLECMKDSDGYTCTFGFDLKTGKSIGGSIC
jgi:hypothetical protein